MRDNVLIVDQFEKLLNSEEIGVYTNCEVIEISGHLPNQNPFNIFTLFVMEDSKLELNSEEFLTPKLIKISDKIKFSFGITKRRISLEEVVESFQSYLNPLQNPLKFDIGQMLPICEQYIKPDNTFEEIPVNKVLKNNFFNGSYIYEFFDETKNNIKFLLDDLPLLNKLGEEINKFLPLKLSVLNDRLGNIIFQFPINIIEVNKTSLKEHGVSINLKSSYFLKNQDNYLLTIKTKKDQQIVDLVSTQINCGEIQQFKLDSDSLISVELTKNNRFFYSEKYTLVRKIEYDINIGNSQPRCFRINNDVVKIDVVSGEKIEVGDDLHPFEKWINSRKYDEQLNKLVQQKVFIQYKKDEQEKALDDIRKLINAHGKDGVFLWDPYVHSANDIKNTLYFTPYSYAPMKIITSSCTQQMVTDIKAGFEIDDHRFLFINLEIRNQHKTYGWKFHDRFLIFPLETPRVWSLGTSVNGLGKEHHILQEVSQPQHILDAFNELWDELNNNDCIVWRI